MSISNIVKSIQDIMRKDAGIDTQRIGQMAWLLFLETYDAQEEELELIDDNHEPPIPAELLWRNRASHKEGITGEDMLEFNQWQIIPGHKKPKCHTYQQPAWFYRQRSLSWTISL